MVKYLKPAEGLDVFIPNRGRNILKDGENILVDAYIEGRIRRGSLVEAVPPKSKNKEIDK